MSSGSVEPCGSQAAWHLRAVWLTDSSDETGESHGGSKQTLGFGNPCYSHKMALIGGMRTLQVKTVKPCSTISKQPSQLIGFCSGARFHSLQDLQLRKYLQGERASNATATTN